MSSPYRNILVICQGNICRSPVAEAMLKQALPDKNIQSAGLGALKGHGAEPIAAEIALANGLDLSAHVARQIDGEIIQWADLILAMSQHQRSQLGKMSSPAMGKSLLIGHWNTSDGSPGSNSQDIPDPYKKSRDVFEHVHGLLQRSVDGWVPKLR